MRFAAKLAPSLDASLVLFHVAEIPPGLLETSEIRPMPDQELVQAGQFIRDASLAELERYADSLREAGVEVKTRVVIEDTVGAILEAADELDVAMIVMGTHGRTGLAHLLMGFDRREGDAAGRAARADGPGQGRSGIARRGIALRAGPSARVARHGFAVRRARRHPVSMRALPLLAIAAWMSSCAEGVPATERRATPRTEATAPEATPLTVIESEPTPPPAIASAETAPDMANGTEEGTAAEPPTEPAPTEPDPVEPDPVEALLALDGAATTSVGGPNDGHLERAVALPESGPGFHSNPRRPNPEAYYGTVELVQALVRAAAVVDEAMPGSGLWINDIGFEHGGPIEHHGSHRAGRDADVLFYLLDRHGDPIDSVGAFLDPRGRGYDFKDLADPRDDVLVRLDAPRTWRFVQALLEGPGADQVQRIFVAEHIRTLLVAQAERAHAPTAVRERFEQITCQPGYPHDDHLHIRFHCTPEDMAEGCTDAAPVYPWRRAELRALGLRPVLEERRRRRRRRARRVSPEDARAAAGPMDARVEEWLDRREAWMHPPHPGRPFCR